MPNMNRNVLSGVIVIATFLLNVPSCSEETGECYDCGPCGFAGNLNAFDELAVTDAGVDSNNVAAVALLTSIGGTCGTGPAMRYWVQYDAGTITTIAEPAKESLDESKVAEMSPPFTWNDRNLSATTEQLSVKSLRITFTEGAVMKSTVCTSADGIATCVEEMP